MSSCFVTSQLKARNPAPPERLQPDSGLQPSEERSAFLSAMERLATRMHGSHQQRLLMACLLLH